MLEHTCQIRFPTHTVYLHVERDHIRVFKYNRYCCDFESFDDSDLAGEYMLAPLPDTYYQVTVNGDNE